VSDRRREREQRRRADGSLVRGTLVSALLHAAAILLALLAPHRMRAAPPTAYTVELVDPGATGGKLLAGPIGGGSASRKAAPPPRVEPPPPPPPPPPEPEEKQPEEVAKAEPAEPEPPEDEDAVALAKATPVPQPTRVAPSVRATPKPVATPPPAAKAKPSPSPVLRANAKATVTPVALARRAPSPVPSPARGAHDEAHGDAKERGKPTPAGSVDDLLAAAIKGVETRVGKAGTPGLSGAGPGGGQGGTERTLNGPAGVGGEGPGGGGAVRGLEFVVYYNQMITKIKESWTYVGDRSDLRVTVRFSILDSGEITDIRLTERSGDSGYDQSVERAVKRAGPLAPPPQAYRKDFADVELTFRPADLRRPSG